MTCFLWTLNLITLNFFYQTPLLTKASFTLINRTGLPRVARWSREGGCCSRKANKAKLCGFFISSPSLQCKTLWLQILHTANCRLLDYACGVIQSGGNWSKPRTARCADQVFSFPSKSPSWLGFLQEWKNPDGFPSGFASSGWLDLY